MSGDLTLSRVRTNIAAFPALGGFMEIDGTTIAWYAVVCGILSGLAPSLGGLGLRLAIGGGVGIFAASVLPALRGMMGY